MTERMGVSPVLPARHFWPADSRAADRQLETPEYRSVPACLWRARRPDLRERFKSLVAVGAVELWEPAATRQGRAVFQAPVGNRPRPAEGGRFSKVVVGGRREGRRDRPKAGRAFRRSSTTTGRRGSSTPQILRKTHY